MVCSITPRNSESPSSEWEVATGTPPPSQNFDSEGQKNLTNPDCEIQHGCPL
ncbi:Hypothetical protein SMAX5B_007102 [Scophthalmus maximus]|uniref:Uncharacterized protein n=1 Tax=Scophthalmus maximus TaxID=52904 RepID=A0A2U9B0I6_SCOMX|nr:Hypothetical protein SMAX5B_007102 [Scophthalmus maximus]